MIKPSYLLALVLTIFLVIFIPNDIMTQKIERKNRGQLQYTETINTACEDASKVLFNPYDKDSAISTGYGFNIDPNKVTPNLELALKVYYDSIFSSMGIQDNKTAQDGFLMYLPIKIAVAYEGYYINTWSDNGNRNIQGKWLPEKPFSYYDKKNNITINVTLSSDYAVIYDNNKGQTFKGTVGYLRGLYPSSIFNKDFDSMRKQIILESIRKDLSYYTSANNIIAKKYHFGYSFNMPYIDDIDSQSFIGLLQGVPIKNIDANLNTYGYGSSKITQSYKYIGENVNGKKYYYRSDRIDNNGAVEKIFDTKIDAAEAGYYPCPYLEP